jgi:hypothetical protein
MHHASFCELTGSLFCIAGVCLREVCHRTHVLEQEDLLFSLSEAALKDNETIQHDEIKDNEILHFKLKEIHRPMTIYV